TRFSRDWSSDVCSSDLGGIRSANADMSNDKGSEKLPRRKTKGSCATLIDAGWGDPQAEAERRSRWETGEHSRTSGYCDGATEKARPARRWLSVFKVVG